MLFSKVSDTYPADLFVPESATPPIIVGSSKFRSRGRFPTLSYYSKENHVSWLHPFSLFLFSVCFLWQLMSTQGPVLKLCQTRILHRNGWSSLEESLSEQLFGRKMQIRDHILRCKISPWRYFFFCLLFLGQLLLPKWLVKTARPSSPSSSSQNILFHEECKSESHKPAK